MDVPMGGSQSLGPLDGLVGKDLDIVQGCTHDEAWSVRGRERNRVHRRQALKSLVFERTICRIAKFIVFEFGQGQRGIRRCPEHIDIGNLRVDDGHEM